MPVRVKNNEVRQVLRGTVTLLRGMSFMSMGTITVLGITAVKGKQRRKLEELVNKVFCCGEP